MPCLRTDDPPANFSVLTPTPLFIVKKTKLFSVHAVCHSPVILDTVDFGKRGAANLTSSGMEENVIYRNTVTVAQHSAMFISQFL